jgi:hypothetical protein
MQAIWVTHLPKRKCGYSERRMKENQEDNMRVIPAAEHV